MAEQVRSEEGTVKIKKQKESSILWILGLPAVFSLLLLWYIREASADVVSTDYIRLVLAYLPDALNPEKLFVLDVFTRIPITYVLRAVNQAILHYSVHFDRCIGVLGLFFSGVVLLCYTERMKLRKSGSILLILVAFGLNKWEMLLNGSGYAHFLAFALFYLNFLLLERFFQGTADRRARLGLILLPWVVLLTAGPYLLVYSVCLLLTYLYGWTGCNANISRRDCISYGLSALLPLLLYLLSNHFAVYEYAGAQEVGLLQVLQEYPSFTAHFFLNGLASMLLSGELMEALLSRGILSMQGIYLLGILVLGAYAFALLLYVKQKLYRRTLFPLLLLLYGLGSHGVVFLSRYVFLRETYAWQSRYALQYQSGILGILLIFMLAMKAPRLPHLSKVLILFLCVVFLTGNCYTSWAEIQKMPYREASYEHMIEVALHREDYSDEELEQIFEYHHGGDRIRAAYDILEENHLNIYAPGREAGRP